MKTISISYIIGATLALSPITASAMDDTFYALSGIQSAKLAQFSDNHLATIQGGLVETGDINVVIPDTNIDLEINIGLNLANITQLNICALCEGVIQGNVGGIIQGLDL